MQLIKAPFEMSYLQLIRTYFDLTKVLV